MKIFRSVALLLLVALAIGLCSCDRIGLRRSSQSKRTINNPVSKESIPPGQNNLNEPTVSKILLPLSPNEYGRANPFAPLAFASRPRSEPVSVQPQQRKAEVIETIKVRLSAILGNTAMLDVGGVSRSVSTGDKLAGMTVVEIKEDKVVLNKDGREFITIKVGNQIDVPKR